MLEAVSHSDSGNTVDNVDIKVPTEQDIQNAKNQYSVTRMMRDMSLFDRTCAS